MTYVVDTSKIKSDFSIEIMLNSRSYNYEDNVSERDAKYISIWRRGNKFLLIEDHTELCKVNGLVLFQLTLIGDDLQVTVASTDGEDILDIYKELTIKNVNHWDDELDFTVYNKEALA